MDELGLAGLPGASSHSHGHSHDAGATGGNPAVPTQVHISGHGSGLQGSQKQYAAPKIQSYMQ